MPTALAASLLLLAATADAPDAPLAVRTQGSLRELFLDVVLADARTPARPSLDVRWAGANTWSTPTTLVRGPDVASVFTDEQADSLTVALRLPWAALAGGALAERGSTAVEWRLTEHWGGWSDPLISWWHRAIRVHDYDRGKYPESVVHLRLGPPVGRPAIAIDAPRLAVGDLVLRSQLRLLSGGAAEDGRERWAVALRLDLKAPVGSLADAGGSGGFDAGGGLGATIALAPWATLHGLASASVFSRLPSRAVLQARRWHVGADVSLALHSGAWALVLEDRAVSALFEGGWTYLGTDRAQRASAFAAAFRAQNQVSVGVRRGGVTVWVSEDVTPGNGDPVQHGYYLSNAPDIVLGVAWAGAL